MGRRETRQLCVELLNKSRAARPQVSPPIIVYRAAFPCIYHVAKALVGWNCVIAATGCLTALQFAVSDDEPADIATVVDLVEQAAKESTQIVLPPELFQGHCFCNSEKGQIFYGSSFIVNHRGDKVAEMGRDDEGMLHAEFNLVDIARDCASFGFFRDGRSDLYQTLCQDP